MMLDVIPRFLFAMWAMWMFPQVDPWPAWPAWHLGVLGVLLLSWSFQTRMNSSSWYPAHRRPWTEIHILAKGGWLGWGGY